MVMMWLGENLQNVG